MKELEGKVAFITGVARGQGRSHAVELAKNGAAIVGIDICEQIDSVLYPMATKEDLDETVRLVGEAGSVILATQADVRDRAAVQAAVDEGVARFGSIDIVLANAGIMALSVQEADADQAWKDSLDVMLTGVWHTLQATMPQMIAQGTGGSVVITSSSGAIKASSNLSGGGDGYMAAKAGVMGLMRGYAYGLAKHSIRVNTLHPTGVATPMVENDLLGDVMAANPEMANRMQNALPTPLIAPIDVTEAVLWLVSDRARYITGVALPVDAGLLL